jgi:hypothetical protein
MINIRHMTDSIYMGIVFNLHIMTNFSAHLEGINKEEIFQITKKQKPHVCSMRTNISLIPASYTDTISKKK